MPARLRLAYSGVGLGRAAGVANTGTITRVEMVKESTSTAAARSAIQAPPPDQGANAWPVVAGGFGDQFRDHFGEVGDGIALGAGRRRVTNTGTAALIRGATRRHFRWNGGAGT